VRALATTLAVLAALLALPAGALANDQVRVEAEGSAARAVTLSGLGEPDVQSREYTAEDGTRVAITGHSLDEVLRKAGADPYRFAEAEVSLAGASVTLSRDELIRMDAFPDGRPVLWMEGAETRFLRPATTSEEPVQLGGAVPVSVRLSRPSELQVRAEASDRRVEPGDAVTFTATLSGADPGEGVDVTWYFDDGRRGSGLSVTHRFRKPGTYKVSVGARSAADEPGADDFVAVRVGRPPRGPDRAGGGTNRDADAPDSGVGAGASEPGGSAGGSSGAGAAGGGEDAAAEDDAATEDDAAAEDKTAAARRDAARRRRAAGRARAEENAARERRDRSPGTAREVTGIELADLSALSSDAGRDALQAARRGRLREDENSGAGVPAAVWWTLGLGALLALGAWREARSGPAPRVT
jgi:plastocyanin